MEQKAEKVEYQSNAYFGVFFPYELAETVIEMVRGDAKWKGLVGKNQEVKSGKTVLSWSMNSDVKEGASTVFVFADDLTFEGPNKSDPRFNTLDLEPTSMVSREKTYPMAVAMVTELHTFMVREFDKKRLSKNELHCGWRVVSCVWTDCSESGDSESSTSESLEKKKKVKAISNIVTSIGTMSASSEIRKRPSTPKK